MSLSLNWYLKSVNEKNSTDSFLSYYIALESLGTNFGEHDIKPLKATIDKIYDNLSSQEVNQLCPIGKVYSLRGSIIHNALEMNIPLFVIEFMRLLYFDLIDFKLQVPIKKRFLNQYKNSNELIDYLNFANKIQNSVYSLVVVT